MWVAAALVAAASGAAHAQCDVYRPGIPDFDQRRETNLPLVWGVPNNGSGHCIPASALDVVAYMANHGAPQLMFGHEYDWADPANYNGVSALLTYLGVLMNTDAGGTGSTGFVNGMVAFFNERAPGQFVVSTQAWADGVPPSPFDMHSTIALGGFPLMVRGTYEPEAENPGVWHRTGGHILAMRNVYNACSPFPTIGARDPNSSDSKFVNSPWGVYREGLRQALATYRLQNGSTQQRVYWKFVNDYGPAKAKILDGILNIMPTIALTGAVVNGEEAGVNIVRPTLLRGPGMPTTHVEPLRLPTGLGPIASVELMPNFTTAAVVTRAGAGGGGGAGKVVFHDISGATVMGAADLPGPAVDTCTSPVGRLYVATSTGIYCYAFVDGSVRMLRATTTPGPVLATAFDDRANQLVVLGQAPNGPVLHRYAPDLSGGPVSTHAFSGANTYTGVTTIMAHPRLDGVVIICDSSAPVIRIARQTPNGAMAIVETIPLPAGSEPRNPQVTDTGSIVVTSRGKALEVAQGKTDRRGWSVVRGLWTDHEFGHTLSLATSRDGMGVSAPTGPETKNIEDEELASSPECPADFNDDGRVDSRDHIEFLAAYQAQSLWADFNDDGTVNEKDLILFLKAFGRGC